MRTTEPTRAFTTTSARPGSGRLFALTAIAAAAGLAACADSLRINVDTGSTGTGSGSGGSGAQGSTGGTGGGGSAVCDSNADCAYPKPVCDTASKGCVECLVVSDCAGQKGTVCSSGACVCPKMGESFCPAQGAQGDRCVDLATTQVDCGACGHGCFGACTASKCADKWEPTSMAGAPDARTRHVAVFTGTHMIVWGGSNGNQTIASGGIYDATARTWAATSLANAPSPRSDATAVWDTVNSAMIVWGGISGGTPVNTGASFDPAKNAWTAIATDAASGAPSPRHQHIALWTGSKMIIWGGTSPAGTHLDDGAIYDPTLKTWTSIPGVPVPSARGEHAAVWNTGSNQMIVFGGFGYDPAPMTEDNFLSTGAIYEPSSLSWSAMSPGPSARARHTAVWSGDAMLMWGGFDGSYKNDGGRFAGGVWFDINDPLPEAREGHSAVWIDSVKQMIIYGGANNSGQLNTGYRLDTQLKWTALPTAPSARTRHTAVVNASTMIIWGGNSPGGVTNTGAVFDASP